MFDFGQMLKKYERPIIIYSQTEGGWVDGQYIEPTIVETETNAAVLPLSNDDMRPEEGGTLTGEDRKMYYHDDIPQGTTVKVDDKKYEVTGKKDYSHFASGLFVYTLVRVGDTV